MPPQIDPYSSLLSWISCSRRSFGIKLSAGQFDKSKFGIPQSLVLEIQLNIKKYKGCDEVLRC